MNTVSPPCFVRSGAGPGEDCLPWLCSKPEAPQLQTPPHFPGPRNAEPAQQTATGQSRGGKNNIFPQTRGLTLPRAGTGQILELKFGAALTTLAGLAVSSHLLPHGGSGSVAQPCKSHGMGIHEAAPDTAGTPWSCCCPLESVPLCVTRSVGLRDSQGQDHHPALESAEHPGGSAPVG